MPAHEKVKLSDMIEAYRQLGSVAKVGLKFGIKGGSVHERLKKAGIECPHKVRFFTEDEKQTMRREYVSCAENGTVSELANKLGRDYGTIASFASAEGLSNARHKKLWGGKWKYMPEIEARRLLTKFQAFRRPMREFCLREKIEGEGFSKTMRKFFPDEWDSTIESNSYAQTMYKIGRALEYRVIAETKKRGFFSLRAPASKGKIDVVAIKHGLVLFFQCKRGGYVGPEEWNSLWALSESVGAVAVVASCPLSNGTVYRKLTGPKIKWLPGNRKTPEPSIHFSLP